MLIGLDAWRRVVARENRGNGMGPSLRCLSCKTDWPVDQRHYERCPECDVKTAYMPVANPLGEDEAMSRKNRAEFERHYAEHDVAGLLADLDAWAA